MVHGELQPVETHLVEVTLPLNYPRTPPQCRMLSPVFHPNIAPHAICVGDHWSAGESLQSIITRIGEMLAYQSYNVKSPLNGEAARWGEQHKDQMPLDRVSMLVEEAGRDEQTRRQKDKEMGAPPPAPPRVATARGVVATKPGVASDPPPPPIDKINCPSCGTSYRVVASLVGRKVRCKKCENVFEIPAA